MKPHLACDFDESKAVLPAVVMPKIDGVRGCNLFGNLTGRSLKAFKNKHVTAMFSHSALIGFDGEFAANLETHPDLCRLTTSALNTIEGEPYLLWWLFDYVTTETINLPYLRRLDMLRERVAQVYHEAEHLWHHLRVVPHSVAVNLEQVNEFDDLFLSQGYEGTIVRSIKGKHKSGRCTAREAAYLRIKRFVDFEFEATELIEGDHNANPATINALGQTERSTHAVNMIPNGMIGAIKGRLLDDVVHGGEVLFKKGEPVQVGAGCLTHDQRKYYFEHQDEFFGMIHKAKFFPKGLKDKPRFPNWQTFRVKEDCVG